jgi:flagellar basal-body rod protein FlgC
MDFLDALNISASGLNAQRVRMNVISSNLANVNTTRTPEGGPYQRKEVIFASQPGSPSFSEVLDAQRLQGVSEVKVEKVVNDSRPLLQKYDPHHPDADAQGYVTMPNINVIEEMVNMISATRSYDANVAAVKAAKNMALKALEIGR